MTEAQKTNWVTAGKRLQATHTMLLNLWLLLVSSDLLLVVKKSSRFVKLMKMACEVLDTSHCSLQTITERFLPQISK